MPAVARCLLLLLAAASAAVAAEPEPAEPWLIEGEKLEGTSGGGTEITLPVITHGGLRVTAARGRLSPDREIAELHGDVRIADSTRTVFAQEGIYRRRSRILDLSGGVHGTGPDGKFDARELTWDRAAGWLVLRGEPKVTKRDRTLWADRIEYATIDRRGLAWGDVGVLLLPDSTRMRSERAEYDDRAGTMTLTEKARLVSPSRSGEAELIVLADTLVSNETDRSGLALGSVRIQRGAMRGRARRAQILPDENRLVLSGDPFTWDADGEIRADSMVVRIASGRAEELQAWGRVRVRYEPWDKPGERNLVVGDTLQAWLREGVVREMEVQGHALSLYLPAVREILDGTGRNLSQARRIRVNVEGGEAERVDLVGSASGTYLYPSAESRRRFLEPAFRDSIVPEWARRPFGATMGEAAKEEPLPLSEDLAAMLERRELLPPDSLATDYDRLFDERVDYEGDTIRFFVPEDRIRILGNGVLRYRGSDLRSHEILYESAGNLVTALGEPELSDAGSKVVGRKMTYRTDEREGIVYRGRTEFEGGYYFGREVKKLAADELLVRQGDYTTCEVDSAPHYHFHADRMKLILKDKAVARPVILYLRNIPVMALPYYIFPLKKGRSSGVTLPDLEIGLNRDAGRFVRDLGYYWAISDYMDARAWIDYYDRGPRFYWNAEYRYRMRYVLGGNLKVSALRQNDSLGNRRRRWSVLGSHRHELGRGASLTMQADFSSDKDYRSDQDFSSGLDERLNRKLKSSVALQKSWSRMSGSLSLVRTQYLDEVTGSGVRYQVGGPDADFNVNSSPLGRAADAQGRGGRRAFLSSVTVGTGARYRTDYTRTFEGRVRAHQAAQQSMSLGDSRKLGPYLRLNPSLSATWAIFGRDNLKNRWRGGAAWSGSVGTGSTLYGTFLFPAGPLAGLRHVVEPSVSWRYSPELRRLTYRDSTGTRRNRFPSVGGIGLSGTKASGLSLSLGQRFHAKWRLGEKVVKQENFLSWSTGTSYNLLAKRRPGQARSRPWSTVSNQASLRPHRLIEASASATHNPYTRAPQSFDFRTGVRLSSSLFQGGPADSARAAESLSYGSFGLVERGTSGAGGKAGEGGGGASAPGAGRAGAAPAAAPWELSLSYNYATSRGSRATNRLPVSFSIQPAAKWRFSSSVYLDLRTREVISHSFSLFRDLHCWELHFDHNTTGNRSEYSFRISVKQIPEVKYEREKR